ncbi:MAG: hypothetical protein ACTS6J_04660, partial [Burkholderiales bacterium]
MSTKDWRVALAAAKRIALRFPGVTGVDYGYKYKAGTRTAQLCARFHVSRKIPLDALRSHEVLPTDLGSIACDVVQARYAPQASPLMRFDPIRPGVSVGNPARGSTGTLGSIVREADNGRLCLLSNWHVLCGAAAAKAGEPISQPGPLHLGAGPGRPVATLQRWLDPSDGYDAAIAAVSAEVCNDDSIFAPDLHMSGVEEPRLGLSLIKTGAASGTTHAMVDGIEGMFELDYSRHGDQKRWMVGLRLVPDPHNPEDEISMAGDSGAVWINPETQCQVALHFAGKCGGGADAECALAHP